MLASVGPGHAMKAPAARCKRSGRPDLHRRNVLAAGAGLFLAGCTNMGSLKLASDTLGLVGKGKNQGYSRSLEEIIALPYAQLGVARGEGPRGIMVLAEVLGEELSWVSGDRLQIVTLHNRIVRTTGFRSDFGGTRLEGQDLWDLYDPARSAGAASVLERLVHVEPGREPPVRMLSRFEVEGEERIEILGFPLDTVRVREDIDVPQWRWTAVNRWWLDPGTRLAWRSQQHLTPDQPPLWLEMLKRPA